MGRSFKLGRGTAVRRMSFNVIDTEGRGDVDTRVVWNPPNEGQREENHEQRAPQTSGLPRHSRRTANRSDVHLRDLFAQDPERGERLTAEAEGLYLDYSKHRVTDETLALLVALAERVAACASASTRCSRRADQRHRGPRRAARRAAGADGRRRSSSTATNVVPEVHAVLDRMAAFADRGPRAASGRATPASASATWSTSASAARTSGR